MAIAETALAAGWLKARSFDLRFILGTAGLALGSAAAVASAPRLFPIVLLADLWLLSYPHVAATFTRLCFDRQGFERHHLLVTVLPSFVLIGTAGLSFAGGVWLSMSVYFYWQWFHYTRQSWGIAKAYRRLVLRPQEEWAERLAFALVPLWGVLQRSARGPETLLGFEIRLLPVPQVLADIVGIAAALALAWWILDRLIAWREGRLSPMHTLYVASHHVMFALGYGIVVSIDLGWLTLNIWHNLQYLGFVWLANHRRFGDRPSAEAPFLATLSRSGSGARYALVCIGFAGTAYLAIQNLVWLLPAAAILYQTINFHHYIVDAIIWRRGRRAAA